MKLNIVTVKKPSPRSQTIDLRYVEIALPALRFLGQVK